MNRNIFPQQEGIYCKVQDRNIFNCDTNIQQKCPYCRQGNKTVDHLATQCGRMLNYDYKKRHNEVVRCLHFLFKREYGLNPKNKIKNYAVEGVIKFDVPIRTETRIESNKPDLLIHDLKKMRS